MSAQVIDAETGEILSTELALPDVADLEMADDPAGQIVLACERAKAWLASGIAVSIESIVDTKAQAAAIATFAIQKQLGKDAELAALEVQRRAERGKGLAIRRGQESGEIAAVGYQSRSRGPYVRVRNGREEHVQPAVRDEKPILPSPGDYHTNGSDSAMTYAVTDDVTDEQFDEAIEEAKAEGNLSRANVVRKVKGQASKIPAAQQIDRIQELADRGYHSTQIAKELGVTPEHIKSLAKKAGIRLSADQLVGRTRRIDAEKIASQTVIDLAAIAGSLSILDGHLDGLNVTSEQAQEWADSLSESMRALNRFVRMIKEATHA